MEDISISKLVYPELQTTGRLEITGLGTEFHIWRCKLDFVFADKNVKYVFTEPIPDKEKDPVGHQKFLDDDLTGRNIIRGCLHENFYMFNDNHDTAKSLLDHIASIFTKPSMTRRMILLQRYLGRKMSDETPLNEHVLNMRALAKELELEGVKIPDEFQAVVLMNSLPESWEDAVEKIVTNIDTDEKESSLENVENRVRAMGKWKKFKDAEIDDTRSMCGFSTRSSERGSFRSVCYGCGEFGNCKSDCPN